MKGMHRFSRRKKQKKTNNASRRSQGCCRMFKSRFWASLSCGIKNENAFSFFGFLLYEPLLCFFWNISIFSPCMCVHCTAAVCTTTQIVGGMLQKFVREISSEWKITAFFVEPRHPNCSFTTEISWGRGFESRQEFFFFFLLFLSLFFPSGKWKSKNEKWLSFLIPQDTEAQNFDENCRFFLLKCGAYPLQN